MTPTQRDQMRIIFQDVAARHGMTEADLYVRDRRQSVSVARFEAWSECSDRGFSLPIIAALGGWHHTSVLHGVRKHGGAV